MKNETFIKQFLIRAFDNLDDWIASEIENISEPFIRAIVNEAIQTGREGQLEESYLILEQLTAVVDAMNEPFWMGLIWQARAILLSDYEKFDASLEATTQAVKVYEVHGTPFYIAAAKLKAIRPLGLLTRIDEAIEIGHWIREVFEKEKFTLGLAQVASQLGTVYLVAWQNNEASLELKKSLKLYLDLDMPLNAAFIRHDLGVIASRNGDFSSAEQYYTQATKWMVESGDIAGQAKLQLNLAENCYRLGQYEQSFSYLLNTQKLLEPYPESPDNGLRDLIQSRIHRTLHQYSEAEQLLERALKTFQATNHPVDVIESMLDLIQLKFVSGTQEHLAESLELLEQLEIEVKTIDAPFFTAWVLLEKAKMWKKLNHLDEAINLGTQVQKIFQASDLDMQLAYVNAFLASCLTAQPKKASKMFQGILDNFGDTDPILAIECHQNLGRLSANQNQWEKALSFFTKATNLLDIVRRGLNTHLSQAGFLESKKDIADGILLAVHNLPDSQRQLLTWIERFKGGVLSDLLSQQPPDRSLNKDLNQLLTLRERLITQLDLHLSALQGGHETLATAQQGAFLAAHNNFQLSSAAKIREQLLSINKQIEAFHDPAYHWRAGNTISAKDLQKLLDEQTVFIAYYSIDDNLFAVSATNNKDDIVVHPLHCSVKEISEKWQRIRQHLLKPNQSRNATQARLAHLWQLLIAPLESRLASKSRLLISPHQTLFQIPFPGLFNQARERYLIDDWTLQIVPSMTVLSLCQNQIRTNHSSLIVGYPAKPDSPNYLPFVEKEVLALGQVLDQTSILLGEEATRENVLQQMQGKALVHLSGHAIYNSDFPLESGMPLANNRWLRASDLYLQFGTLSGALVVLSGCETGRGHLSGAEVIGLNSAFLYAGASGVVSGLWKVDDAATALLMKEFYFHLSRGEDTAVALQKAQKFLNTHETFSAPYYWASFNLTGDRSHAISFRE
ncbi:MAG: CHAT domain-containing protein [Chloroflexota bacterium]